VKSPQPPRAVEHFLVAAYKRAVARVGRALWRALEPLIPALAKPREEDDGKKLDAPPPDGSVPDAVKTARKVVQGALGDVKRDVEAASKAAAKRADRHAKREMARIGIKLTDADPQVAKLVPAWRKTNVARITGMLEDQLDKIERILEEGDGHYAETLAEEIQRQCEGVSASRAEFIARDQILTLNSQITTARMKDAGIEEFYWTTSGDERVRDSHRELDGQLFRYDDPPIVDGERALPGEPPLCRCTAFPRIPELEDDDE
jgi:SPP1 gp7 family putative phage head morphogenesis protein